MRTTSKSRLCPRYQAASMLFLESYRLLEVYREDHKRVGLAWPSLLKASSMLYQQALGLLPEGIRPPFIGEELIDNEPSEPIPERRNDSDPSLTPTVYRSTVSESLGSTDLPGPTVQDSSAERHEQVPGLRHVEANDECGIKNSLRTDPRRL